jgi:O-methyltransferase/8-demethyl-8-(2,3-dimethoxy-alpha-L-rhamnosyl)tetracenomycin-C 4'-O-methyltransferase
MTNKISSYLHSFFSNSEGSGAQPEDPNLHEVRNLYLSLIKECLSYLIYADVRNKDSLRYDPENPMKRPEGIKWPAQAHTMIGMKRLDNIQFCVEDVLSRNIEGDLIETGVWRGGATIFMRAILKGYQISNRKVWVADSFEGLPVPDSQKYPADIGDRHHEYKELAVSLEQVQSNFQKYNLLDNQVEFLKGWFRDTLPKASIKKLAVMRLDGDMYESTMDALVNLYPKLSVGGYVIVDDYGAIAQCRQAVHDYRNANGINDEIKSIDWTGVYWKRTR